MDQGRATRGLGQDYMPGGDIVVTTTATVHVHVPGNALAGSKAFLLPETRL